LIFPLAQNQKSWHLQTSSYERTPRFGATYKQIDVRATLVTK
jgi:hypothetical protein